MTPYSSLGNQVPRNNLSFKENITSDCLFVCYKHHLLLTNIIYSYLSKKSTVNVCFCGFLSKRFRYQNQFDPLDQVLGDEHSSYLLDDLLLQEMLTSQTMVQKQ